MTNFAFIFSCLIVHVFNPELTKFNFEFLNPERYTNICITVQRFRKIKYQNKGGRKARQGLIKWEG